jgi:hypothetical protein
MPNIQRSTYRRGAMRVRSAGGRSVCRQLALIAPAVGMLLATIGVVGAQPIPLDQGIWKKSQVFQPKPSFDQTPVEVTVVAVTYRIPRNYLTDLGPQLPAIRLAWPGLHPLTQENQNCFGSVAQGKRAGCTFFKFRVRGSGGRLLGNSEKFEYSQKTFPKHGTRQGPFGYEIHSTGPNEARREIYRRTNGDIYFICLLSEGRSRGICNDTFRLEDANHLQFYLGSDLIEHVADIEASMRKLMASFVIKRSGAPK